MVVSSNSLTSNQPSKKRVGELLVESGLITEADFAEAMLESKKTGVFIGQVLIRNGKITGDFYTTDFEDKRITGAFNDAGDPVVRGSFEG